MANHNPQQSHHSLQLHLLEQELNKPSPSPARSSAAADHIQQQLPQRLPYPPQLQQQQQHYAATHPSQHLPRYPHAYAAAQYPKQWSHHSDINELLDSQDYGNDPKWRLRNAEAIVIATPPPSSNSKTTTTITITTTSTSSTPSTSSSSSGGTAGTIPKARKNKKVPMSAVLSDAKRSSFKPEQTLKTPTVETQLSSVSSSQALVLQENTVSSISNDAGLMFVQPSTTGLDPDISVCTPDELQQLPPVDVESTELVKLDLHYLKPLFAKKQVEPETAGTTKKKRKPKSEEPGQIVKQPVRFEFQVPRKLLDPNICITVWCLKRYVLLQCNETFVKATEYPLKALTGISVDRFFGTKPRDPTVAKSRELSYKLRESLLQHTGEVARTDTAYFSRTGIIVRQIGAIKVLRSSEGEPVALISYQTVATRHEPEVRTRTRGSRVAAIPEPKIEKVVELKPYIHVDTPGESLDMENAPPATDTNLTPKKSKVESDDDDVDEFGEYED
eukprot:TRINITY_DN16555_c0_g1_i1.p1 TRINITY_DN16555_c0_g1~~TRINITY_DN16555_c0_g1_i1.p1  ORF type:complete len:502 (+),score=115.00 TRINITY_DN16555_c0_g1_i1:40-1545(+)